MANLSTTSFLHQITPISNPITIPKLLGQPHLSTKRTHYLRVISASSAMATDSTKIKVVPAVIVGGGRVGRALQEMGNGDDLLIKRGEAVPLDFAGPILVCTRNDDLQAVLQATPQSRWSDLVFFQNGMLEPWFQSNGLGDADQVLAYFAISKLGEPPIDGKTDTNPEGLTAAFGKWASA
ncbi:Glutamate-1-semialdehyde 2 1-aminomutase, partial [Bienertia sinuspersici]